MKKSLKKVKGKTSKRAGKNSAQQISIEETKNVTGGTGSARPDSPGGK